MYNYICGILTAICLYSHGADLSAQITTLNPGELSAPAKSEKSGLHRSSIYLELLGQGGLYSLNYDLKVSPKISLRAGISVWGFKSIDFIFFQMNEFKFRSFPIMVNYLPGKRSSRLELGLGIMPTYISTGGGSVFYLIHSDEPTKETIFPLVGNIGYRYQPEDGGIMFRAGLTPSLSSGGPGLSFGISIGFSF